MSIVVVNSDLICGIGNPLHFLPSPVLFSLILPCCVLPPPLFPSFSLIPFFPFFFSFSLSTLTALQVQPHLHLLSLDSRLHLEV